MADATLPQRLNRRLFRIALLLAALVLAAGAGRPMMDNVDLGWHLAQGRWMVEHGTFYRRDLLNYPTFGRPIVNEYPLFQLALYLSWKLGWWGPCLLTAAGYVGLIALLARGAIRFRLEGSVLFILGLGALLVYLQLVFPLRPHLVTYLGTIALGLFLLRHRAVSDWRAFWPAALLQVAWANSHGGFLLGPAMVGCFGLEVVLRRGWNERRLPWETARTWTFVFLLILLACCLNPAGAAIFYPPIFQDRLEAIRAFVGEMEPVTGALGSIYLGVTLIAAAAVAIAATRRGDLSWSFLFLATGLLIESLSVKKTWPVFGLFVPLLVLSSGAWGRPAKENRPASWLNLLGNFSASALLLMALLARLSPASGASAAAAWREYDAGRSELSLRAAAWMRAHDVQGRILHRCEDGGCLQQFGYDRGETFGDTGFGKYDEAFIRDVSLLGERPALLPRYLAAYRPACAVCDNFAYAWPAYLRSAGWRLIFYSPYSSVWTQPGTRPDLPTVPATVIETAFDADLAAHGRPGDMTLYGRNILELNSLGLEDFALARLRSLPPDFHHAPWYWEAARILCFETPPVSPAHRNQLVTEAENLHDDTLTAEFRAYALDAGGDLEGARNILAALAAGQLSDHAADLLLRLDLVQGRPGTLSLAERNGIFDLRDGWHWALLAQAEEKAGRPGRALAAWRKAVFYYPDDPALLHAAEEFAEKHHAADLSKAIAAGVALPVPPTPLD